MGVTSDCRVAIVGAGYMAREHVRAFQDVPGAVVTGICSRTRARAEALAGELGVAQVFDSIHEMADATEADLVVVTVPELQTQAVCADVFKFPWAALIEKPAGYTVPIAEAIAETARAAGRRAFVALNRRHYSSTRAVLDDLASQDGQRLITVRDQEDLVAARESGQPELVMANWMYANSVHVIDYFRLFGRGDVAGVDRVIPWDASRPGYVAAKISFTSGDVGLYEAVWDGPAPWAVTVNTPAKRWELRPLEKAAFQRRGTRVLEAVDPHAWDSAFKPGLRRQAELAVKAARGETTSLPTLEDALASMRLVRAIYE